MVLILLPEYVGISLSGLLPVPLATTQPQSPIGPPQPWRQANKGLLPWSQFLESSNILQLLCRVLRVLKRSILQTECLMEIISSSTYCPHELILRSGCGLFAVYASLCQVLCLLLWGCWTSMYFSLMGVAIGPWVWMTSVCVSCDQICSVSERLLHV